MHKIIEVELGADILAANKRISEENAKLLKKHGIISFDFVGAIGSGKTQIIEAIVDLLKERADKPWKCAAIAGDLAGNDDYRRFKSHDIQAENLNTGKECHLDAHLVDHALEHLDLENIDVLFIENVGNLICPTDFPLGTDMRVLVVSVTEGDDMVRKHPLIFRLADIVVINKIDLAEAMEVDPKALVEDVKKVRPDAKLFLTDARRLVGIPELMEAMGL
jgi:hydrogenase nickel incorporation protein HypB